MAISIDILNSIRANADGLYQERVPEATQNNIEQIGRAFEQYDLQYNQFMDALIHKIGLTLLQTKSFKNKLKRFKSGSIVSQQDVEEIFVNQFRLAEGTYDKDGGVGTDASGNPTGIHPFKRRKYQDVKVAYHRMNRQDKYVITISKVDVIRAFKSPATLDSFMIAQFNSIYTGAEYDEYIHMKQLFAEAIQKDDFFTYYVPEIDGTTANTMAFVRTAKKAIKDLEYPSANYNPAEVMTTSNANELVMFVNKDVAVHLDVDLYAQIFGPNYAKMNITTVEVDNFGADDSGTYALICDGDWFKVYDTLQKFTQLENPEGLYTNYWLHIWQILSYSRFKNAIRLAKQTA